MCQRGQRFEMMPEARRFLKAHRGCGLIARPREFTKDRTAAPAQKTNGATNALRVAVGIDAHVARRSAVAHLPIDARRKFLVRSELAAAGAQPEDPRQLA